MFVLGRKKRERDRKEKGGKGRRGSNPAVKLLFLFSQLGDQAESCLSPCRGDVWLSNNSLPLFKMQQVTSPNSRWDLNFFLS